MVLFTKEGFSQINSFLSAFFKFAINVSFLIIVFPFLMVTRIGARGNRGDTVVGNDVWIGQNVTILPGVHIGDGAIIGANSVVAKDVPPYSVVVGNPAEVKKYRFDEGTREFLLKLKWWDKDVEIIRKLIPLLTAKELDKEQIKKIVNS